MCAVYLSVATIISALVVACVAIVSRARRSEGGRELARETSVATGLAVGLYYRNIAVPLYYSYTINLRLSEISSYTVFIKCACMYM